MSDHKTFFGKIFGSAWDAIKGLFSKVWENADHDLLQAAILVTSGVKAAIDSGVPDLIASITDTKLDDKLIAITKERLPLIVAAELGLQGINNATTQEDVQAAFEKIADAFGITVKDAREKFFTSVAAQMYKLWMDVKAGKKITFGESALLVESMYQQWLKTKDQP